ncbi:hypothetical protein CO058_01730 [candidate division WWE3 bacterium CG_4_9_14_0_2_um_filter_35_11]|uniref:Uncharacterized protein n=1 Tax=candidate division WWE3 bacterium CG_4_9_14_0_2_um_filter_35_11 TaxID=1975077 RepID=A0A2M8EM22_UNCKA|nr:MAG: hypothetical protein CO058_01730 [candidate division WWE3 bacterium CG_4_9_14_0_2_um_filter_35_11]
MQKTLSAKHIILPVIYYFSLSFGLLFISMYWLVNGSGEIAKSNAQVEFQEASDFRINLAPSANEDVIIQEKINPEEITENCQNIEARKINAFFEKRKTPLAGYGCVFLKEALLNDLNPYLLPAIAQAESSGGKTTPKKDNGEESYNAWGWAVYDDKSKTIEVDGYASESWEVFIGRVAGGIKVKADNRGLTTSPQDVVVWYNPGSVITAGGDPDLSHWARRVSTFMGMIEETEI